MSKMPLHIWSTRTKYLLWVKLSNFLSVHRTNLTPSWFHFSPTETPWWSHHKSSDLTSSGHIRLALGFEIKSVENPHACTPCQRMTHLWFWGQNGQDLLHTCDSPSILRSNPLADYIWHDSPMLVHVWPPPGLWHLQVSHTRSRATYLTHLHSAWLDRLDSIDTVYYSVLLLFIAQCGWPITLFGVFRFLGSSLLIPLHPSQF